MNKKRILAILLIAVLLLGGCAGKKAGSSDSGKVEHKTYSRDKDSKRESSKKEDSDPDEDEDDEEDKSDKDEDADDEKDKSDREDDKDKDKSESEDGRLGEILDRGTVRVGIDGTDYMPWSSWGGSDEPTGFDVEVAEAVAEKLGVEVEFIGADFDALLTGLNSDTYDLAISGIGVTPDREDIARPSDPYVTLRQVIVTGEDTDLPPEVDSIDDAIKDYFSGISRVGVYPVSYYELEAAGIEVAEYDTLQDCMSDLESGKVDAVLCDNDLYYEYLMEHPDSTFKASVIQSGGTDIAAFMKEDSENDSLEEAVNDALEDLREDGTLKELSEEYFGGDITE